jgi:oligogalacturonide transport system ATP-binding protein
MRVRITDLHKRLRDEGRPATVVYVTHDQVEAMTMGDRICVMKDGHIMQVADPVTLYDRPANAFVAGFIGMPEMNLVPATLNFGQDAHITVGDQNIKLEGLKSRVTADAGPVTFGVRPQHLELTEPDTKGALTGTITNLEFMGHEVNLHAQVGAANIVCVVPSDEFDKTLERGDRVGLTPRASHVHLFDPHSGENISLATNQ